MSVFSARVYAASYTDTQGHWAENGIEALTEKGILSEIERGDNKFEPDANITRAEFFVMINNAFEFTSEKDISFSDVKESDWFYRHIKRAAAAGYITGYEDNTIKPNAEITRSEVCVLVSKILNLPQAPGSTAKFADAPTIPAWALPYIESVIASGFMGGYPDSTFGYARNETRAEAVSLISSAMNHSESKISSLQGNAQTSGDITVTENFGPESGSFSVSGNVTVNTKGITVKNLLIKGNLIVDASKGTGNINLLNVKVEGKIIVKTGSPVTYSGNAASVKYGAAGGVFRFVSGQIASFTVTENANGSKFQIEKGAVIDYAEISAPCTFVGSGEVTLVKLGVRNVYSDAGLFKSYAEGSYRPQIISGVNTGGNAGVPGTFPYTPVIPPNGNGDTDNEEPMPEYVDFEIHVVANESGLIPVGKKGLVVFIKEAGNINYAITEEQSRMYIVSYADKDTAEVFVKYSSEKEAFFIEVDEVEGMADTYYSGKISVVRVTE
jgi:hypothetical protein